MIKYIYTAYPAAIKKKLGLIYMNNSKKNLNEYPEETPMDGGKIIETDAMGREKFWEDLGRPNDWKWKFRR